MGTSHQEIFVQEEVLRVIEGQALVEKVDSDGKPEHRDSVPGISGEAFEQIAVKESAIGEMDGIVNHMHILLLVEAKNLGNHTSGKVDGETIIFNLFLGDSGISFNFFRLFGFAGNLFGDVADLIFEEHSQSGFRMFVVFIIMESLGDVLSLKIQDECGSAWMVIKELGDVIDLLLVGNKSSGRVVGSILFKFFNRSKSDICCHPL